jgi:hypothetical protein
MCGCAALAVLIAALPGEAGAPLWQLAYPGRLVGVAGPVVVFQRATGGGRQELVTFAADSGRRRATLDRWRAEVGGRHTQLGELFVLGPLIGGELYPSYAGLALVDPVTDRVRLRSTGREHEYVSVLPGVSREGIAVADGELAVLGAGSGDGCIELRGIDLRSGQRRWRWSPQRRCSGVFVALAPGAAVVYSDGQVQALDLRTGRPRWRQPSPICDGELCDGMSNFRLAADDELVALALDQRLAVHSAKTGTLLAQADLGDLWPRQVLVSGGRIYLGGAGVSCRNPEGRELWHLALEAEPSQLVVGGEVLYVAAQGVVRALERTTGAVLWTLGADRIALAPGAVILGRDGEGAVAYQAGRAPGREREVTVSGRVTMEGRWPARVENVRVVVAGVSLHPARDGSYRIKVRLAGGRIAVSAHGCTGDVGPLYQRLDERSEYRQDLQLHDHCLD